MSKPTDTPPPVSQVYTTERELPEDLPASPWGIFEEWWTLAHTANAGNPIQPNPNAMTLATADDDGSPSARIVLCKGMDLESGLIVFYTNRMSRKGQALKANPRAALIFHWDPLDLQVRIEGPITQSPDEESDAYFASRPTESKLGAWGSRQSQPLGSRDDLIMSVAESAMELGVQVDDPDAHVPRPKHWGGYRVWAETVELWCAGVGRVHDRARWTRPLKPAKDDAGNPVYQGGSWAATRLYP